MSTPVHPPGRRRTTTRLGGASKPSDGSCSYCRAGVPAQYREAFKCPKKRSSSLLAELQVEERERFATKEIPRILPGDAVELMMNHMHKPLNAKPEDPHPVKGLVIGLYNMSSSDAQVQIHCEVQGMPFQRRIPIYSPRVKSLKVTQRAFLHKGQKRVRRAKLYYLTDQNKNFKVPT